jgi:hypothetical protein
MWKVCQDAGLLPPKNTKEEKGCHNCGVSIRGFFPACCYFVQKETSLVVGVLDGYPPPCLYIYYFVTSHHSNIPQDGGHRAKECPEPKKDRNQDDRGGGADGPLAGWGKPSWLPEAQQFRGTVLLGLNTILHSRM